MEIAGTMKIYFRSQPGVPQVIRNVPVEQYERLSGEIRSNAGFRAFEGETTTGAKYTIRKADVFSIEFEIADERPSATPTARRPQGPGVRIAGMHRHGDSRR
jgi:hypothetical protein